MTKLLLVFIVALMLRLLLVFAAYHGDLNNNIVWGTVAVERGLNGFYGEGTSLTYDEPTNPAYKGVYWSFSVPNQPPLSIMIFAGSRLFWQAIENTIWWLNNTLPFFYSPLIWFWETKGMSFAIKLPGILADLGIALLIYNYFKQVKTGLALPLAAIWLFNPVSWYNSSIWGQTDSVVNFLGFAAILTLLQKRLIWFSLLFTLSLLFKSSLFIFLPVVFFISLWQRHRIVEWAKAIGASLLTIIVVTVWFHPAIDLLPWLVNLYKARILPGEIDYLTANAFNFWWLIDSGKTFDSSVYLGLPARIWGFIIAGLGIALIIKWLHRRLEDATVFYALALTGLLVFLFMTRMHERYLYPFFPSATILVGLVPGFIVPFTLLSVTHLLNLYHLFWAPTLPPLENLYTSVWFANILSIINLFVFVMVLRKART